MKYALRLRNGSQGIFMSILLEATAKIGDGLNDEGMD